VFVFFGEHQDRSKRDGWEKVVRTWWFLDCGESAVDNSNVFFIFTPICGEMIQNSDIFFQMGGSTTT